MEATPVVARQGRHTQRYTDAGGRRVVGCIPYRFKAGSSIHDDIDQSVEVLVISSQKGHGMMFPKGGWENDESIAEAASREAMEEAGVQGLLEDVLDTWNYRSRRYGSLYEATMFPMHVTKELTYWPEMGNRKRSWVSVAEVMEGCDHMWMKEALEKLVSRLSSSRMRIPSITPSQSAATSSSTTMETIEKSEIRQKEKYLHKRPQISINIHVWLNYSERYLFTLS